MVTSRGAHQGFTLARLLLAVAGLLTLALALPPVVAHAVNAARTARATGEAARIAAALDRAAGDLGELPRWVTQADRQAGHDDRAIRTLTGPGAVPKVAGDASWLAAPSDTLTRQLVENGPGYPVAGGDRAWRGPYLRPDAGPDPWGNQFIVWFTAGDGAFVVSAGIDGTVDTNVPALRSAADVAGDDVVVAVGGRQ